MNVETFFPFLILDHSLVADKRTVTLAGDVIFAEKVVLTEGVSWHGNMDLAWIL